MPIVALSYHGREWPIDKFVQACLSGDCDFPAPIAQTILRNMVDYDNRGTISGSQLHSNCDYSRLLERAMDYTVEIEDQFYASFRGSNVHAMIERCRSDPAFKHWVFEKRFFAVLHPDNTIEKLLVPQKRTYNEETEAWDETDDWDRFKELCDYVRGEGGIILSGALDAYDKLQKRIHDWKTAKTVGSWTSVKESWQQQMSQYMLLAILHGYAVEAIRITVMDATQPLVLNVPVPNMDIWVPNYLIPRARYLDSLQRIPLEELKAILRGEVQPPEGFPTPVVNYLCDGGKRGDGKVYCPFRENFLPGTDIRMCPAWREKKADEQLTKDLKASVKEVTT